MFFRREKPRQLSFDDSLANLKSFGIESQKPGSGRARVSRTGCVAILEDGLGKPPSLLEIGVAVGHEIGVLWSAGYQMFLATPSGKKVPARAEQLVALHAFEEDLKEALGLPVLYNEALGTTSPRHMYDRVEERDVPRLKEPWKVTTELARE